VRGRGGELLQMEADGTISWNDAYAPFTAPIVDHCVDEPICENPAVKIDGNSIRLAPDSAYPQTYLKKLEEWSKLDSTDTLPPPSGKALEPSDLICRSNTGLLKAIPSGKRSEIQENIDKACTRFQNTELTPEKHIITTFYPISGDNKNAAFAAALSTATECGGSRRVEKDICNSMLSSILSDCDKDSPDNNYGGLKHDNCIEWKVGVMEGPLPQQGDETGPNPTTPGGSGGSGGDAGRKYSILHLTAAGRCSSTLTNTFDHRTSSACFLHPPGRRVRSMAEDDRISQ
jgi:hypothetical protein